MVQLSAFLQTVRKKVSSLMEPFKELKRQVSRLLSMPAVKKIFFIQTVQELENTQMVELKRHILMEQQKAASKETDIISTKM